MRPLVREFIELAVRTLTLPEPILEMGSLQVEGQESIADLRPLFLGKKYTGFDMQAGKGVDEIMDATNLPLSDASVGTVITLETLEHVEYPRKALMEAYRVLRVDGVLVVAVPFSFPLHPFPNDYWRFTPWGLESLLQVFPDYLLDAIGHPELPHTVVGVAFKDIRLQESDLTAFTAAFNEWKGFWDEAITWQNSMGSREDKIVPLLDYAAVADAERLQAND